MSVSIMLQARRFFTVCQLQNYALLRVRSEFLNKFSELGANGSTLFDESKI
jgi:hypothetical protein